MALIGDVIQGFREAAVDQAVGVLPPPGMELATQQVAVPSSLTNGTYFVRLAYRTNWGETLCGNEGNGIVVDAGHSIQIFGSGPSSPTIVAIVAYYGIGSGAENQFIVLTPAQLPFTISAPSATGFPRLRSTAYLPDSDGSAISAFSVYRWLNDGLKEAAGKCGGGLPDLSGIASVAGQGIYTLTGNWWKCMKAWYDGYPMGVSGTDVVFRKNKVTGSYAMAFVVDHVDERVIIEVWPQPSRTSGSATLTNAISASAIGSFALTNPTGFVLPQGLAQIGSEIVYYTTVGSSLVVAVRGLGGTVAQAWPANTSVVELNIFFHGLRVPPAYSVGQSANTLNVPPGWEPALSHYLLHRFKLAEKQYKASDDEYKKFSDILGSLPLNKPVGGPRQIQVGGGRGAETQAGLGSYFGGVIVP